jgi:restriction system protein
MLPDFQSVMLPLLESLKVGAEQTTKQTHETLAQYFELTDEELNHRVPGRDETMFQQTVNEAKAHLLRADLLFHTNPNCVQITPLGKQVLSRRLNRIDTEYLKRLPGYQELTGP